MPWIPASARPWDASAAAAGSRPHRALDERREGAAYFVSTGAEVAELADAHV
jgi:hypothetical protein